MNEWMFLIMILLLVVSPVVLAAAIKKYSGGAAETETLRQELRALRQEMAADTQNSVKNLGEVLAENQKLSAEMQDTRLRELNEQFTQRSDALQKTVNYSLSSVEERMKTQAVQEEQKLENIRTTMENRLAAIQKENGQRLDQMRETVDEKLQKTLEDRIGQSFQLVSDRLEQVYKGLGEMQTLASGVGDLKKVLSNVKTRGILGEIQLGAILGEILSQEQYEENIATKPGSSDRVEFAIRMPGDGDAAVYLPIDAKFPADVYAKLQEAYDSGEQASVDTARTQLERAIKGFAKDIRDKYIDPPHTTDFAIMFLPFEGLYAEVVRFGLVEALQNQYKVNIAGPTTMAALLNSLQMGFKTLAIQKRSSEVWNILGAVKTEFENFEKVLASTQKRLEQANSDLDKLVGVRTRKIQSKLKLVTSLPEEESRNLLDLPGEDDFGQMPLDSDGTHTD